MSKNLILVPAGVTASKDQYQPGDFILTRGDTWYAAAIRFGQALTGTDKRYCRVNHAALIVSGDGDILEALANGITPGNLSKYHDNDYIVVRLKPEVTNDWARINMMRFANHAKNSKYDWIDIFSICLTVLTAGRFKIMFGTANRMICSAFVATALLRTGFVFEKDANHIMPSDLAEIFEAILPL